MYYVIAVLGCEPFVEVIRDDTGDGRALTFDSREEAEEWAFQNCAWTWKVVSMGG